MKALVHVFRSRAEDFGDVMKQFACGDVVPGCTAVWQRETEDEILREVAAHAAAEHGMTEVPDDVVHAVRAKIVSV